MGVSRCIRVRWMQLRREQSCTTKGELQNKLHCSVLVGVLGINYRVNCSVYYKERITIR